MDNRYEDTNGIVVFVAISIIAVFLMAGTVLYITHTNGNTTYPNSVQITGYLHSYYYGYKDDKIVFEVCISTKPDCLSDAVIYELNPSQKESFLRYNTIGSQVSYFASTKSVYEIRSLENGKEDQYQYNGTQEQ